VGTNPSIAVLLAGTTTRACASGWLETSAAAGDTLRIWPLSEA